MIHKNIIRSVFVLLPIFSLFFFTQTASAANIMCPAPDSAKVCGATNAYNLFADCKLNGSDTASGNRILGGQKCVIGGSGDDGGVYMAGTGSPNNTTPTFGYGSGAAPGWTYTKTGNFFPSGIPSSEWMDDAYYVHRFFGGPISVNLAPGDDESSIQVGSYSASWTGCNSTGFRDVTKGGCPSTSFSSSGSLTAQPGDPLVFSVQNDLRPNNGYGKWGDGNASVTLNEVTSCYTQAYKNYIGGYTDTRTYTPTAAGVCTPPASSLPACVISASAVNPAPAYNTNTFINFTFNGTYPWSITKISGDGVLSPAPFSGTGTSGGFNTGNLTTDNVFRITCGGVISDVTVSPRPPRAPECKSVSPSVVNVGDTVTATAEGGDNNFAWNAPGGTPGSAIGKSTTFSTSYSSAGTKLISVTDGLDRTAQCPDVTVNDASAPVVTLTASPTTGASPITSTLNWSATKNPNSCTASASPAIAGWSGPIASSGSSSVANITAPTTFTVSCTKGSNTGTASVVVSPTPSCVARQFTATPNPIVTSGALGVTTVNSDASCMYDVRVGGPSGTLFTQAGPGKASVATGNWVSNGTQFYLQKRDDTTAGGTLATLTVNLAKAASVCGNGMKEGIEQCDNGSNNGPYPAQCGTSCFLNAVIAQCGNGIREGSEQCDLGALNGSCPSSCTASCSNQNSCMGLTSCDIIDDNLNPVTSVGVYQTYGIKMTGGNFPYYDLYDLNVSSTVRKTQFSNPDIGFGGFWNSIYMGAPAPAPSTIRFKLQDSGGFEAAVYCSANVTPNADLAVQSFELTDAQGNVKTNFAAGEQIYPKLRVKNIGQGDAVPKDPFGGNAFKSTQIMFLGSTTLANIKVSAPVAIQGLPSDANYLLSLNPADYINLQQDIDYINYFNNVRYMIAQDVDTIRSGEVREYSKSVNYNKFNRDGVWNAAGMGASVSYWIANTDGQRSGPYPQYWTMSTPGTYTAGVSVDSWGKRSDRWNQTSFSYIINLLNAIDPTADRAGLIPEGNESNNYATVTYTVGPPITPVVTLSASPNSGPSPLGTTVAWNVTNSPTTCTASGGAGGWTTPVSKAIPSGFQFISGLTNPTTFTMTCTNSAGTGSGSVTVTPVAVSAAYTLTVTKPYGGYIKTTDNLINCGTACTRSYARDTVVTLKAFPNSAQWKFIGWSGGGCAGTGDCFITMDAAKTVTGLFSPRPLIYQEF